MTITETWRLKHSEILKKKNTKKKHTIQEKIKILS